MNKIAKLMLAIIIIMICSHYLEGQSNPDALSGDMGFKMSANSNYRMQVTMTCASIPFEGLTNLRNQFKPFNRVGKVQNGSIWRFFSSQGIIGAERNIYKISSNILNYNEVFDLMHSSGSEYESSINYVYGYAKYLVEILIYYNNIETERYRYFYNTLDSKFGGKDTTSNTTYYIGDLYVRYNVDLPLNRRLEIFKDVRSGPIQGNIPIDTISTADTLNDGTPTKEVKVWEQKYPPSSFPVEQNFYASTTPFGLRPEVYYENAQKTEILIGTKVIFDSVYNNKDIGSIKKDTIGYNTRDDNAYHRYYTLPPVGFNDSGNTYTTTSWFNEYSGNQKGLTFIADSSTTLEFRKNKKLWISGIGDENIYDVLILKANSKIIHYESSGIYTFRYGKIVDDGCNITWASNTIHRAYFKTEFKYNGSEHIVNNGGKVRIDSLATLSLAANTTLVFDGNNTNLELKPGAIVKLGENAKIEFRNGAYLNAKGGTISSLNASTPGRGLFFYNSTGDTISGCTFTNLKNPIYINGTPGFFGNITNNSFDETGNNYYNYVIETVNANNISISYNQINMQTNRGVGILTRYPANTSTEAASSSAINVYNNSIQNGMVSAAFVCLTDAYAIVNFRYNYCYGNATSANIVVRHITGDFKENNFYSSSCKSLELNQAIPNLYHNTFTSTNFNVNNYESYPRIAPISENTSDGGWIWAGGRNIFSSTGNGNIYYYGGTALLDWGENHFEKSASYQNLWGEINEPDSFHYYVRNNCFGSSYCPSTSLVYISDPNQPVDAIYSGSTINCNNSSDAGAIWQINDLGNGVYDTLYKTSNNSGYQPSQDEALYSSAVQKWQIDDYFSAITYFKSLITNFPVSSYTDACLYSLYKCYQALDTSYNLNNRDDLYTDLKNYLDGRILTGSYSEDFNYTAYEITIMCLASINNYNDAMAGYEFIALYHPDAYTRLLASWDYAEVQALLNGSGGTSSKEEKLTDEEYFAKITKRVSKGINEDPIKKKVKKSFDKVKSEKIAKSEKDAFSKTKDDKSAKLEVAKMKQKDEMMNTKVTSVMRYSKTLKKEEREKMQIEDILFSNKTENKDDLKVNTNVPVVYSLSQNYPNPFNPVTKINFALPKQGLITLKIYDITGREINTLVNEVKQAGNYTVDFNGSLISSGVYFYKIQSGDFVSVKRMVLIK